MKNKRKESVKFCIQITCSDKNCKHYTLIKCRQMVEFKTCPKFKEIK